MSVLPVGIAASGDEGYTIEDSLRFRSSASAYLNVNLTATDTSSTTATISFWVKRGKLGAWTPIIGSTNGTNAFDIIGFDPSDKLVFRTRNSSSVDLTRLESTSLYRDTSAWYHIVAVWDTDNATSSDRVRLYVNGERITSFNTATYPSSGMTWTGNFYTGNRNIGRFNVNYAAIYYADMYCTEVYWIDGQALDPTDFGEYDEDTGVWKPKAYTGTYGTNGFYLDASTSGSTVLDQSGNSNNWTANNMNLTTSSATTYDLMNDVPTLTDEDNANYATINPLAKTATAGTYADGNLKITTAAAGGDGYGTMSIPSSGKYYWEVIPQSGTGGPMIGIGDYLATRTYAWQTSNGVFYYSNGDKYVDNSGSAYGSSYSNGDVIGVAVDADAGDIEFFKNNVSQGSITHQVSELFPVLADGGSVNNVEFTINFGQQPFAYTPPTGFLPLNTYNLPDSTIVDGSKHFNTVLYTGNGTTGHAITGVGFQPDFTWLKGRSTAGVHGWWDAVRGATKYLVSNSTAVETTDTTNGLQTFESDGFTLGSVGTWNTSSAAYASWNWKANGSGVSNTDGDIPSTVSANTTSGFSIATFTNVPTSATGYTIGHGLGVTPSMIIVKKRASNADNWYVQHASLGNTYRIQLNLTSAATTSGDIWFSTSPTSSVFTIKGSSFSISTSDTFVAYCFAAVEGFSAFGKYTGNGSTDGPFIYTGFRPAWVMMKRTNSTGDWWMQDSERNTYNVVNNQLYANSSSTEQSDSWSDFLSNGFKIRNTYGNNNGSGSTYIYAAFAENPFKNSLAR